MDSLISRQAAIDAIKVGVGGLDYSNDQIRALERLPSAQSEQHWIPVAERLPEEEEDFLVTDGESMAVGYYRQDAKAWDSADFGWIENREKGYGINEVIAWMPLPYPYRKDGD